MYTHTHTYTHTNTHTHTHTHTHTRTQIRTQAEIKLWLEENSFFVGAEVIDNIVKEGASTGAEILEFMDEADFQKCGFASIQVKKLVRMRADAGYK